MADENENGSFGALLERVRATHIWLASAAVCILCYALWSDHCLFADFGDYWLPWAGSTGGVDPSQMYQHVFHGESGQQTPCNYMPFVPYLLTLVALCRRIVGAQAFGPYLIPAVKLPFVLAYVGGAPLCYYGLLRPYGRRVAVTSALLYLGCAPLLVNCALWGQADTLLSFALAATVVSLLNDRPSPAGALFGWAIAIKLQAVFLAPVLVVYVFRRWGMRPLLRSCLWCAAVLALFVLPIVLLGGGPGLFSACFGSVGYYPYRTNAAHNVWFLLNVYDIVYHGGPLSNRFSDLRPLLGPLTARSVGLLCFGLLVLSVSWRQWRRPTPAALVFGCVMTVLGSVLLLTEMHERYWVPAAALCALGAPFVRPLRIPYLILLVVVSIDQYLTLFVSNQQSLGVTSTLVVGNQRLMTVLGPAYDVMVLRVGVVLAIAYVVLFAWMLCTYFTDAVTEGDGAPSGDVRSGSSDPFCTAVSIISGVLAAGYLAAVYAGYARQTAREGGSRQLVPPWTGPRHQDYRDLVSIAVRVTEGMSAKEVAAAVGMQARVEKAPERMEARVFPTSDGDLQIVFRDGIVSDVVARQIPILYKTPATRATAELVARLGARMCVDEVRAAIGFPSGSQLRPGDPIPELGIARGTNVLSQCFPCRDGLVIVVYDQYGLLTRTVVRKDRRDDSGAAR